MIDDELVFHSTMATPASSQRIDVLLALALAFDESGAPFAANDKSETKGTSAKDASVQDVLSALDKKEQQAVEQRRMWYAKLNREKQGQWLAHTLGSVRAQPSHLDEHVHPSHIIEALLDEPPRVQALVLRNLPRVLAATCAAALQATRWSDAREQRSPASLANTSASAASSAAQNKIMHKRRATDHVNEPAPEIITLVRRTFLSHFIAAGELHKPDDLDLLSGIELARLVRLLGVRETAVACRGIERMEDVAAFLRRFSAEDAHAIASHISRLTEVESSRVAFAHQLVHEALNLDAEPEAMLDRLGLRLLAIALIHRESLTVAYLSQKIPVLASRALAEMMRECSGNRYASQVVRLIAKEAETVAQNLRRAPKQGHVAPTSKSNNSPQPSESKTKI